MSLHSDLQSEATFSFAHFKGSPNTCFVGAVACNVPLQMRLRGQSFPIAVVLLCKRGGNG